MTCHNFPFYDRTDTCLLLFKVIQYYQTQKPFQTSNAQVFEYQLHQTISKAITYLTTVKILDSVLFSFHVIFRFSYLFHVIIIPVIYTKSLDFDHFYFITTEFCSNGGLHRSSNVLQSNLFLPFPAKIFFFIKNLRIYLFGNFSTLVRV